MSNVMESECVQLVAQVFGALAAKSTDSRAGFLIEVELLPFDNITDFIMIMILAK